MVTLLGSLLGFFGSAFPDIIKVIRDKHDRNHELAILDKQLEHAKIGHQNRLEELQAMGDAVTGQALYKFARHSGVKWVDGLAGTVRPIITYAFFLLYAVVKVAQWVVVADFAADSGWAVALDQIWNVEDQALFATIISFWFGQRLLHKGRPGVKK